MSDPAATYGEFWPSYLRDHADPRSRAVHYVGSILALAAVALAVARLDARWLLLAPLVGYGCAWFGHFAIERNKPATFRAPFWSLFSDYRMLALWATGRLGPHLARAGVTAPH
jgi:hypothetical protein